MKSYYRLQRHAGVGAALLDGTGVVENVSVVESVWRRARRESCSWEESTSAAVMEARRNFLFFGKRGLSMPACQGSGFVIDVKTC